MVQVLAVFAGLERRLIGERTKAALAVRRAQGVRLGRPKKLSQEVVDRIVALRRDAGQQSPGEMKDKACHPPRAAAVGIRQRSRSTFGGGRSMTARAFGAIFELTGNL